MRDPFAPAPCRDRRPWASGSRVSPMRCRRASRQEKAVSRQEGVRWLRLGRNTRLLDSEDRLYLRSAEAQSPPRLLHPPAVPSHRGTENMLMLVADGFYFRSIRRSDTYTAMVSPCEGQGLHLASQSTLAAATGLALHARKGRGGVRRKNLNSCLISFI